MVDSGRSFVCEMLCIIFISIAACTTDTGQLAMTWMLARITILFLNLSQLQRERERLNPAWAQGQDSQPPVEVIEFDDNWVDFDEDWDDEIDNELALVANNK
jgi:hypothetical protein